jgi:hypothetical protein
MSAVFDQLRDDHVAFIAAQPMFFVASAPSGADGHVNLSPKGSDSFRVLDRTTVAYLDYTGSGAETIAHVRDNARLTIMFISFGPKPLILRLFGRGDVLPAGSARFDTFEVDPPFPDGVGARSIIRLAVDRVQTSCGYGVPIMELVGQRPRMAEWADAKGRDGVLAYQGEKNQRSIDGLPALEGLTPKAVPQRGTAGGL